MSLRLWLVKALRTTYVLQQRSTRLVERFNFKGSLPHATQYTSLRYISDYHQLRLGDVIKSLHQSYDELQDATRKSQVDDIAMHWSQLRRILLALPEHLRKDLCKNHIGMANALVDASGPLSKRGNVRDAQILVEMLTDSPRMLECPTNPDFLKNVLGGLVRAKQSVKAYDLLRAHHRYTSPGFRLNSTHFFVVMYGLRKTGDVEKLKSCIGIMKSGWPHPNVTHYRQLVLALIPRSDSEDVPVTEMKELLDELELMKLPYDKDIHSALQTKPALSELAEKYNTTLRNVDKTVVQQWIEGLKDARKKGKHPFQQKLKQVRSEGFMPDVYALSKLVDSMGVSSLEELMYLRDLLEVEPNVFAWSVLLNNVLRKRGISAAIEVFETAKKSGIRPSARMLHPLLMYLCNGKFTEPSEENIDRALKMYDDLVETGPERISAEGKATSTGDIDTAIYNTLLRALTSHANKQKYFPRAFSLLEDMHKRQLSMDAMTAASVGVLLVRSASSYSAAYAAYRQLRSLKGVSLDAEAYAAILHAYCSLDFQGSFPYAKHYFAIINDMQAAGIPKTDKIYTILLGRYADIATRFKSQKQADSWKSQEELLAVIQDTHRQLTLDASVTPNAPLWNQLMDAYNRVGHFKGVMDVWSILNSSGLVDHASVSVVLDACGFQGVYEEAKRIFTSLQNSGFPLNTRNWNSWIECLARVDRLDEALSVVCDDMCKEVQPDDATIQVLVSFATRAGRAKQVCSRVELQMPDVWEKYKRSKYQRTRIDEC